MIAPKIQLVPTRAMTKVTISWKDSSTKEIEIQSKKYKYLSQSIDELAEEK